LSVSSAAKSIPAVFVADHVGVAYEALARHGFFKALNLCGWADGAGGEGGRAGEIQCHVTFA
jgi:hypothetical protein